MARTHTFQARIVWNGSTAAGYDVYSRDHAGSTPPATVELAMSAAAAFGGDPARLNPEQLLVLAASSCHLLTFLAIAARSQVNVIAYEDDADADMSMDEKPIWIREIRLRPRITVASDVSEERVLRLVEMTHRECFVVNSIKSEVIVSPRVVRAVAV